MPPQVAGRAMESVSQGRDGPAFVIFLCMHDVRSPSPDESRDSVLSCHSIA